MLTFHELVVGSAEHRQAVRLREVVLRQPLQLAWTELELSEEALCFHFAACEERRVIATLLLKPIDDRTIKMRQVAVEAAAQRRGVGSRLIAHVEAFAQARGYTRMIAHARESAAGFYQRLGYSSVGEVFIEVTIPHRAVVKELRGALPAKSSFAP